VRLCLKPQFYEAFGVSESFEDRAQTDGRSLLSIRF
jgi:hypothetical protein